MPASPPARRRSLLLTLLVIALPVLLLGLGTAPAAAAQRHRPARSWIAFTSDRDSVDQTTDEGVNDDVYLLDPRTRRTVRITDDPAIDQVPLISPDGKRLLWQSNRSTADLPNPEGRFHLWTCRLHLDVRTPYCDRVRVVPRDDLPTLTIAYAWLPGHRSVVYTDAGSLYRVALDGSAPVLLAAKREGAVGGANQPTVSPDGRQVVVNDDGDLWRIDLGTGGRTQLTATPTAIEGAPEYSPDGSRLAFHSNRSGAGFDIWTMAAAPETPLNPAVDLTADLPEPAGVATSWERYPTWSPDGRQIAFAWYIEASTFYPGGFNESEIYRVSARGGHVTNLTRNYDTDLPFDDPAQIGDIQPDWGGRVACS